MQFDEAFDLRLEAPAYLHRSISIEKSLGLSITWLASMIAYLIYKDKGNSDRKRIRYIYHSNLSLWQQGAKLLLEKRRARTAPIRESFLPSPSWLAGP